MREIGGNEAEEFEMGIGWVDRGEEEEARGSWLMASFKRG
jgi:hypothetical protein